MAEVTNSTDSNAREPQCQFFVVRKKRLCRMTVRPGRQYCGEHEPEPKTDEGEVDNRIPCPFDPKHTCFVSKLEKHLLICNARPSETPPYIVHNINAPPQDNGQNMRRPLTEVPKEILTQLINKINVLYDKYLQDKITMLPEEPIHNCILQEFSEAGRGETSRRHLRQTSALLHAARRAGLVADGTCYVELGAGRGCQRQRG